MDPFMLKPVPGKRQCDLQRCLLSACIKEPCLQRQQYPFSFLRVHAVLQQRTETRSLQRIGSRYAGVAVLISGEYGGINPVDRDFDLVTRTSAQSIWYIRETIVVVCRGRAPVASQVDGTPFA